MNYRHVSVTDALRAKAASLVVPGNGGPGAWVQVEGDIYARKWDHAPSAGPGSGTLEIVSFT